MIKKPFNSLNDYFVRYFFRNMRAFTTDKGWEKVLLDFINADIKTFKAVEILNLFNLIKNDNVKVG